MPWSLGDLGGDGLDGAEWETETVEQASIEFTLGLEYLILARQLEAGGVNLKAETRVETIANYRARWSELWAMAPAQRSAG